MVKMSMAKAVSEKLFTQRDVARVHNLAEDLYKASKANPDDSGYLSVEDAWDYAIDFHMYSLNMWDSYHLHWEEKEKKNG